MVAPVDSSSRAAVAGRRAGTRTIPITPARNSTSGLVNAVVAGVVAAAGPAAVPVVVAVRNSRRNKQSPYKQLRNKRAVRLMQPQ